MSTTAAPRLDREATDSAEAASLLFERHRPRVLAFCLSRTRNRSDAEDAAQTTFMYALSGLRRGVIPDFELSWLLRIAENVCHSQRRRAHRRYEREELPAEVASDHRGDPAVVSERLETIASALGRLPEAQRRAIILREWRGLSYHDIAAELGTSHAAVETLLFRARRSLAKQGASFGTAALELARLARWLLGTGAGKAAVVAATTVAVGVAGEHPATGVPDPGAARLDDGAARVDALERVRPKVLEIDRVVRTARAAAPTRIPAVEAVPAGAPTAGPADSPTAAESGATTGAEASSPPSVPASGSNVIDVASFVDLDEPSAGVEAVLEPVDKIVEEPLEPVPVLESAVPEVRLPGVELVEKLPAVAPELPRVPRVVAEPVETLPRSVAPSNE